MDTTWKAFGDNIETRLNGEYVEFRMKLDARLGESSSGKSIKVASTGGNQVVPDTRVVAGINLYIKK